MSDCELSRFDAHQGVYNATVKNCTLGRNFNIIGAGTLTVENVRRIGGAHFLWLRSDYGSTWNGDIIFKDCTMTDADSNFSILGGNWTDWDFGYECYLPENITIDNFVLDGASKCYVFSSSLAGLKPNTVSSSQNPYHVTKTVTVKNENTPIELASGSGQFFAETKVNRV